MAEGTFKSVPEVIKNDLTPSEREQLATCVMVSVLMWKVWPPLLTLENDNLVYLISLFN